MKMSAAERRAEHRWARNKYGLTPAETDRLLACPRQPDPRYDPGAGPIKVELQLEAWRAKNGYPHPSSPLSRGMLLELISKCATLAGARRRR